MVTAENTVTLNHSFSHCTWKLTQKVKNINLYFLKGKQFGSDTVTLRSLPKYDWEYQNIDSVFIREKGTEEESEERITKTRSVPAQSLKKLAQPKA